jgi:DNA-binding MarR family transcriptional regulator
MSDDPDLPGRALEERALDERALDERALVEQAEELRAAVGEFVRRVRAYDRMPPGQVAVLGRLDRSGPLSLAELARRAAVKHQSMTRTVNLLVDQGLVSLGRAEADRRQVVAGITAAGKESLDQERRSRAGVIAEALRANLTARERDIVAQLPAILRKLLA